MSLRAYGYRKRQPVRITLRSECTGGGNSHMQAEDGATGVVTGVKRRPPALDGHEVFVMLDRELWRERRMPHWPIAGAVAGRWYRPDELEAC
jgi:hypothetical protein